MINIIVTLSDNLNNLRKQPKKQITNKALHLLLYDQSLILIKFENKKRDLPFMKRKFQ